ncbi:MAG: hypothetical protein A2Y09_09480 [Planctomycetes bacterium GWA2_39_15]|nr:MAG: hypothetical protein A2Y09_09480 [Planctomycetes bacterium GWA2_39_15]
MNNIAAIIQATYSSDIFPGKSMVKIAEKTILEYIVLRIRQVKNVSEIILATSNTLQDNPIVAEAEKLNIKVFRGSKSDLVSRLYEAVKISPCETILKINGNYPLFDPYLANDLISEHIREAFDFSYNEHINGTLYGTGCEVVKKILLLDLNNEKLTPEQRESGTLYFHQNEYKFKVNKFVYLNPRPHYKVCFDTEKDLKLIEFIFKNLNHPYTNEIIELLDDNPILAESNRFGSVQEVGIEKLYLFPEKVAALINRSVSAPDYTYPISVELSLTNKCNFNCVWCSDKDLRARLKGEMDFEVLKNLLIDLKRGGTRGIVLEGGGEPTLHEHFENVVNFAHKLGFGVGLITNGSHLLKDHIVDKFDWIRVSLDASNPEEHFTLKNNDNFERIMSNINALCTSKATVGIGYVVTSKNISSLESLILRLFNFGVSYIQFRPVIDHPELETNVDLSYLKRYENNRFSINVEGMNHNLIEGNDGLPCIAHSLTTIITADGGVYLCGRLNIYPWFEPIGNVNSESFYDIWHGEKRREQYKMILDGEFNKKYCPKCRLAKFNQLFNRVSKMKTRNFI